VLARTKKTFNAASATAIVMDPRTGEILVSASVPRVDPDNWNKAQGIAQRVPAITDQYAPGSTFKAVTIAGALEDGVVTPDTKFDLPYSITFCKEKKTCTVRESHKRGRVTLTTRQILTESSNIGTIHIAKRLGGKRVDEWNKRFGFGTYTG